MRIENIAGCELLKKEESVDDVLVVYCAKHPAHKFTMSWDGINMLQFSDIIKRQCLLRKIYNFTMQWQNRLIVYCFLQASDQERFNGKYQENQVVGLMDLDGQMCGMQVKRIAGYKIILRD